MGSSLHYKLIVYWHTSQRWLLRPRSNSLVWGGQIHFVRHTGSALRSFSSLTFKHWCLWRLGLLQNFSSEKLLKAISRYPHQLKNERKMQCQRQCLPNVTLNSILKFLWTRGRRLRCSASSILSFAASFLRWYLQGNEISHVGEDSVVLGAVLQLHIRAVLRPLSFFTNTAAQRMWHCKNLLVSSALHIEL